MIADPDLLLLDEPTNHLDIGAIEWLEEHLRRRTGALLVASHDRAFLDATVTRIWELRDRQLTAFRGDYSAYHRQRIERDERAGKEADSHDDAIAREIELVQRYRSQRKHVKMHEHEARLEKLKAETPRGAQDVDADAQAPRRRARRAGPCARARSWSGSRTSRSATCRAAGRWPPTAPRPRSPSPSRRRRSSRRSAASGSGSSGRTARARRRCCARSRATCRRSTGS